MGMFLTISGNFAVLIINITLWKHSFNAPSLSPQNKIENRYDELEAKKENFLT